MNLDHLEDSQYMGKKHSMMEVSEEDMKNKKDAHSDNVCDVNKCTSYLYENVRKSNDSKVCTTKSESTFQKVPRSKSLVNLTEKKDEYLVKY